MLYYVQFKLMLDLQTWRWGKKNALFDIELITLLVALLIERLDVDLRLIADGELSA